MAFPPLWRRNAGWDVAGVSAPYTKHTKTAQEAMRHSCAIVEGECKSKQF